MKTIVQKLVEYQKGITRQDTGFSLLELVVAVSIMLILATVGFVSYQAYTDNARQAAVESAANQVLTATVAAYNTPERNPDVAVREFNTTTDDMTANITTASAEYLEITAEDTVGTIAIATTAGNFTGLDTTNYGLPGVTYGWVGTPHNSQSIKMEDDVEVARNILLNPQFKNNANGWIPRENYVPRGYDGNPLQVVPRDGRFSALEGDAGVGDTVLYLTRKNTEEVGGSFFTRMDRPLIPSVKGYSHIGYRVPMQGTGKTWMYFRGAERIGQAGLLPETEQIQCDDGCWRVESGPIPEGAEYADLYLGSAYERDNPEGERYVNEVYYGYPLVVVGNSQAEVDEQLATYFDGDTQ